MLEKIIHIKVLACLKSDLLMACSEDLKGLSVQGRSLRELEIKLPILIRELLETDGLAVENIEIVRENDGTDSDFVPPALVASAHLIAA